MDNMLENSKVSFDDLISEIISTEKRILTSSGDEKDFFEKKLSVLKQDLNSAVDRINNMEIRLDNLEKKKEITDQGVVSKKIEKENIKEKIKEKIATNTYIRNLDTNTLFKYDSSEESWHEECYDSSEESWYEECYDENIASYVSSEIKVKIFLNEEYERNTKYLDKDKKKEFDRIYDSEILSGRKNRYIFAKKIYLELLNIFIEKHGLWRFFPLIHYKKKKQLKKFARIFELKYSLFISEEDKQFLDELEENDSDYMRIVDILLFLKIDKNWERKKIYNLTDKESKEIGDLHERLSFINQGGVVSLDMIYDNKLLFKLFMKLGLIAHDDFED